MAYAHTNSKGNTYYLHSNGRMFYFSKEIKEGTLEAVPAGYNIVEMKTGMLVLKKVQAAPATEMPAMETPAMETPATEIPAEPPGSRQYNPVQDTSTVLLRGKETNLMPALNRVQLIGYLGKDPESKFTSTGKKFCHFSVGVTQRWKAAGEMKEHTDWFNIEAWGRLGEICQEYLKKGSLIYLEGRLRTDKVEDKGETKYYTKVVALLMQMLDRKPAEEPMLSVDENAAEYEA